MGAGLSSYVFRLLKKQVVDFPFKGIRVEDGVIYSDDGEPFEWDHRQGPVTTTLRGVYVT